MSRNLTAPYEPVIHMVVESRLRTAGADKM